MVFTPVTRKTDIRTTFERFQHYVESKGSHHARTLGYPGGHTDGPVDCYWFEKHGFWCHPGEGWNRYWVCFGLDPDESNGTIVLEINPAYSAGSRRMGGLFLLKSGESYLAHRGRVAGGTKGVGQQAFLDWYPGELANVEWGTGIDDRAIPFGPIGSPRMLSQLAEYVERVASFKQWIRRTELASLPRQSKRRRYSAEFVGRVEFVPRSVEVSRQHGTIVAALQAHLRDSCFNDKARDLYACDAQGCEHALFEVKTDATSTSIYTGVGQLVLHGGIMAPRIRRVLVIPKAPDDLLREQLPAAGIEWVTYRIDDTRVRFVENRAVLSSIRAAMFR